MTKKEYKIIKSLVRLAGWSQYSHIRRTHDFQEKLSHILSEAGHMIDRHEKKLHEKGNCFEFCGHGECFDKWDENGKKKEVGDEPV